MRFTTRDLLWLMLVVSVAFAIGTAWWRDKVNLLRGTRPIIETVYQQDAMIQDLKKQLAAQPPVTPSQNPAQKPKP